MLESMQSKVCTFGVWHLEMSGERLSGLGLGYGARGLVLPLRRCTRILNLAGPGLAPDGRRDNLLKPPGSFW